MAMLDKDQRGGITRRAERLRARMLGRLHPRSEAQRLARNARERQNRRQERGAVPIASAGNVGSVEAPQSALAQREALYAARARQDPLAALTGDPPPGYSALDRAQQSPGIRTPSSCPSPLRGEGTQRRGPA